MPLLLLAPAEVEVVAAVIRGSSRKRKRYSAHIISNTILHWYKVKNLTPRGVSTQASLFKKLCRKTDASNMKAMQELKTELLPFLPRKKNEADSEVLESLKSIGPMKTQPFLPNVQWKNGNITEDVEGGCEDWEADGTEKKKKKKRKVPAKKKGAKGKPVQSEASTPSEDKPNKRMTVFGKYTPGKFAEARKRFIAGLKDTCGYREACQRWSNSDEKWELLSEMPYTDNDFVEVFAGCAEDGRRGVGLDVVDDPMAFDLTSDVGFILALNEAELLPPKDPYFVDMTKTDFELFRDHMADLDKDVFDDVALQQ
ncbi:unnamed protein product [Symbiodinium sp. CCMP2456]|nr:unnamed protein product [Symbiodinium sp. CCMP2456]